MKLILQLFKTAVETYLKKFENGTSGTKANNWYNTILNNSYFQKFNELESDGNPLLLVPVQFNSTDASQNFIFYYYYNPATAPTEAKHLPTILRRLPKYQGSLVFLE